MYIFRLLGFFSFVLAISLSVPLIVVFSYGELELVSAFMLPVALCVMLGVCLYIATKRSDATISIHGGMLLTTLCWLFAATIGAIPFFISGAIPNFVDAFFESMSGFTTTGATILVDIESLPFAILFWRSFIHWLGGMGIIVLLISVLPRMHGNGQQLFRAEVTGLSVDRAVPRIGSSAQILWVTYCIFTVAEILLLMIFGMSLYDAATHSFATMATGGFSTQNASIGAFQSDAITTVITIFMIFAGINFNLYFRFIRKRTLSVWRDPEFGAYMAIISIATIIVASQLLQQPNGEASVYNRIITSLFHVVSILTTTGFVTENFNVWPALAQAVLFLLMFCGACSGSTGGGVKIIRVLWMAKQGTQEINHTIHSHGIFGSKLKGALQDHKTVLRTVSGFFALYLMIVFLTMIIISAYGYDVLTSLTTGLATLGNIGPGFGRVGAIENYAHFPPVIKYYLSFVMMCGRLEIFTVLALFSHRFWRRSI